MSIRISINLFFWQKWIIKLVVLLPNYGKSTLTADYVFDYFGGSAWADDVCKIF